MNVSSDHLMDRQTPHGRGGAKKSTYAILGALFILTATILQRFDGGGLDLAILIVLGIGMLVASADLPNRKARDGPRP